MYFCVIWKWSNSTAKNTYCYMPYRKLSTTLWKINVLSSRKWNKNFGLLKFRIFRESNSSPIDAQNSHALRSRNTPVQIIWTKKNIYIPLYQQILPKTEKKLTWRALHQIVVILFAFSDTLETQRAGTRLCQCIIWSPISSSRHCYFKKVNWNQNNA